MTTATFETSKLYGNDLTIEVLKRTEKTVTIKTNSFGEKRVKIKEYMKGVECIYFKSWIITANESFCAKKSTEISMYNAYCN